ncbi:Glycine--tRNA ligase 1, mitochondrial [Xylographa opegraphella]|nr:Glycine--tRNA ligase 1, mitochondrial [Xylographa opegraphella]
MAPSIASAKLTLSYPLYAADFDPSNSDFLVVGGGGGEGRSGVGNKITLIDTSRKQAISEVADVDLSRNEDSVTSLAIAQSSDTSAIVFAGVNSSGAEQQAGRNEHLRSFRLGYPPRTGGNADTKEAKIGTVALGKVSLFKVATESKKETYQRVLRLSPANNDTGSRLGVIATGLAAAGEVVIFDASRDSPTQEDVRQRVQLGKGEEAADVDVIESKEGGYLVAYCTDYEVYVCKLPSTSQNNDSEPQFIHGTPHPDVFSSGKKRPTFRSLRFLTPSLLLLLQNQPNRSGAELLLLEVPGNTYLGTVVLRKVLHRSIKSASALATALLPASNPNQDIQHVIAIAGQDISITILTLYHSPIRKASSSLRFNTCTTLYNVHPLQMTALTFSTFRLPTKNSYAIPHYLKLASTSMSSTVIVHTFALSPHPQTSRQQGLPARFVLQQPASGDMAQMSLSVIVSIIVVALGAFLLQAWTEIRGGTPEYLGAKGWLSQRLQDYVALPYMFEDVHVEMPVLPSEMPKIEEVRSRIPSRDDLKDSIMEDASAIIDKAESLKDIVAKTLSLRSLLSLRNKYLSPDYATTDDDEDEDEDDEEYDQDNEETTDTSPFDLPSKAILVRDSGSSLSTELRSDMSAVGELGKPWEELTKDQRELWKSRLIEAGEWTLEEGETVLKGVFFGQIGGLVGEVVGGMMGGS